jgi:hypothetical protein
VFKENAEELFNVMSNDLKQSLSVFEDAFELTDSQLKILLDKVIKIE